MLILRDVDRGAFLAELRMLPTGTIARFGTTHPLFVVC